MAVSLPGSVYAWAWISSLSAMLTSLWCWCDP